MSDAADQPAKPSKLVELRKRHEWLDHLVRAAQRYTERHGDHYAAAITYFSVLALFPLLMIGFSGAALFLRSRPELIGRLKTELANAAPGELSTTLSGVIDSALQSAGTVGVVGLAVALYSGLGWMGNLREALSEQWGHRQEPPNLPRRLLVDLAALIGLGLALLLSVAVTAVGGLARPILRQLGLAEVTWLNPVIQLAVLLIGLLASSLVFLWVIAKLPREPVGWRSAVKAALVAAVGFELIKRIMVVYLDSVTNSPAGAAFGPILGLLVFIFTVSRFLLFLTAWAATARENEVSDPDPAPPPAVIRTEVTVREGARPTTAAGLLGAGAVAGLLGGRLLGGRRRA